MTVMTIVSDPKDNSLHSQRIAALLQKLNGTDFQLSLVNYKEIKDEFVVNLIQKTGMSILPITLVNGFPMFASRYPSNDEIKQILNIPDGIIDKKLCGCCCIEGSDKKF